ncbi:hypothetical protein KFL_007530050 [Klebsormidium nitens]|uniref:Transmembrane protein 186 n=1 Tax=Klebsormidium nitens TaxID=105231 RepID=A0A1Y1IRI6_KLENI|nr:hypothetical protein KFL_007530050 [Klebsormidium nitens]|eukprot:GAQ91257.1 hypothetical protein KFL_007530050 [Klebsormidium nitens]
MIRVRHRLATLAQHLQSVASLRPSAVAQTQLLCDSVPKAPLLETLSAISSIGAANDQFGFGSLVNPQLTGCLVDIKQLSRRTPFAGPLEAELQAASARATGASTHKPECSRVVAEEHIRWPSAAIRGSSIRSRGHRWPAATTTTTTPPWQLRTFSSDSPPSNDAPELADKVVTSHEGAQEKLVLYRGRWIKPLRLLVRLKVLQLTGVSVLAIPIVQYTQHGHVTVGTYAAVGLVVSGAAIASAALWFYSRRYIGELSLLLPKKRAVRFSTLDFWGRRQDTDVAISRLVPPLKGLGPAALREVAQHAFVPLEVTGDRQYILSLRHGHLLEKDALIHLLTKDSQQV